jgi:hypothetical protein
VRGQRLVELHADPERRVERRRRILGHVGDQAATQALTLDRREGENVLPSMRTSPRSILPAPRVPENGEADGRLAGPDSPTSPSTFPAATLKVISSTMLSWSP